MRQDSLRTQMRVDGVHGAAGGCQVTTETEPDGGGAHIGLSLRTETDRASETCCFQPSETLSTFQKMPVCVYGFIKPDAKGEKKKVSCRRLPIFQMSRAVNLAYHNNNYELRPELSNLLLHTGCRNFYIWPDSVSAMSKNSIKLPCRYFTTSTYYKSQTQSSRRQTQGAATVSLPLSLWRRVLL